MRCRLWRAEPRSGRTRATAIGSGPGTPGPAPSNWPSPSSARGSTRPSSCSSPAGGPSRPWSRSSARPTSKGSRRGRVDDLVKAMGIDGISKSEVSRLAAELDKVVTEFKERPLDAGPYRYLWIDALTQRVREGGRVVNVSAVIATAVNARGQPRDHRLRHRHHRGHRRLDGVPALPGGPGAQRGGARHLRRPRGHQGRHRLGLRRGVVAAVPHPLHGEPGLSVRQGDLADDRHLGALDLRAARPRHHLEPAGRRRPTS